jgi:hypothetical protein
VADDLGVVIVKLDDTGLDFLLKARQEIPRKLM